MGIYMAFKDEVWSGTSYLYVKDVVIDFTYRYQDKLPLRIICGNSQRMINLAEESLISHSITFSSPRFGIIRIEKI